MTNFVFFPDFFQKLWYIKSEPNLAMKDARPGMFLGTTYIITENRNELVTKNLSEIPGF